MSSPLAVWTLSLDNLHLVQNNPLDGLAQHAPNSVVSTSLGLFSSLQCRGWPFLTHSSSSESPLIVVERRLLRQFVIHAMRIMEKRRSFGVFTGRVAQEALDDVRVRFSAHESVVLLSDEEQHGHKALGRESAEQFVPWATDTKQAWNDESLVTFGLGYLSRWQKRQRGANQLSGLLHGQTRRHENTGFGPETVERFALSGDSIDGWKVA
ncbi:hypothetical protein IWX90DRAFT_412903 [Phyllosticta citrichinensis]|uniref:Uncharacterized protein n=1 Tax=Phyllosticta citrichinensis TaxID=1130410 RepID=A0ABR1XYV3_9PEZI